MQQFPVSQLLVYEDESGQVEIDIRVLEAETEGLLDQVLVSVEA